MRTDFGSRDRPLLELSSNETEIGIMRAFNLKAAIVVVCVLALAAWQSIVPYTLASTQEASLRKCRSG